MDDHTHGSFMDMPFVRSREEVLCEKRLARLIPKLWADGPTSTSGDLALLCGGDHARKEWFVSNHEY